MKPRKKKLKKIKDRGGVYPLWIDENGKGQVYLMIPSKPKFGGPKPQMGKGGINKGETAEEGALREGCEELGLKMENVKSVDFLITDEVMSLRDQYKLSVFVAHIKDPDDFGQHDHESKWAGWVNIDEALFTSRTNQHKYLRMIKEKYEI